MDRHRQPIIDIILPDSFFRPGPLVLRDGNEVSPLDKIEIIETVNRFDWCYLAHHREGLAAILTDDVVFDHAMVTATGKEEVLKIGDMTALSYGLRHNYCNHVIFVTEDGAAACASYALVVQLAAETPHGQPLPLVLDHAVQIDEMRREEGRWKIRRRTIEQQKFADAMPMPADVRRAMTLTSAQRKAEGGAA